MENDMKLIAALLLVAPAMLTAAHAGSDDTERRAERQRSIYEVATGRYQKGMYEGRSATRERPRGYLSRNAPRYPRYDMQDDGRY
jgi:hypothetical protein